MKRTITSLLASLPLIVVGCGGDGGATDCTASGGSSKGTYVANTVTVPTERSLYSIDLDGDGRSDNALGNIIGALKGQGLDVQMGVDQALQTGGLIMLATETSTDPTFQSDSCASTTLQLGKVAGGGMPDFTNPNAMYTASGSAGTFNGPIAGGKFNSAPPA